MLRPMARIGTVIKKRLGSAFRSRRTRLVSVVLAVACLATVGLGSGLALGWRPLEARTASAVPLSSSSRSVAATASAGSEASASPAPSPAVDIASAIASQSSWILYRSTAYRFSILHPPDWGVSETQTPGWAIISGWDSSNLSVTWRTIPSGTTLSQVTDEVWKAMHDAGFTVDDSEPGMIAGLPARILTLNGTTAAGHPRHGIIGIVVTATGRYRLELWTRPGSEAADVTLYDAFLWTFRIW